MKKFKSTNTTKLERELDLILTQENLDFLNNTDHLDIYEVKDNDETSYLVKGVWEFETDDLNKSFDDIRNTMTESEVF